MKNLVESDLAPEFEQAAERLTTTIEAGDMDGWLAAYTDDGVIWHSHDGVVKTAADHTEALRFLFAEVVSELRYDDVRRYQIDGGYVQQHTLRMTSKTGEKYSVGVCVVAKIINGRVQRLDEYLDSSVFQFAAPMPGATV